MRLLLGLLYSLQRWSRNPHASGDMVMLLAMRCCPAGSGLRPAFFFWFILDVFC
jgi:hypothetical protein